VGIIQRQGIRNAIITYVGFALGAISLLFIQPHFLSKEEIGLTRVLFSFSALLASFMQLGMINVTLKYFPYFRNREKKHYGYFGLMLILPAIGFLTIGGLLFLLKGYVISKYSTQSKLFAEYFYYVFPLSFFITFTNSLIFYSFSLFRTSFASLVNDILVRIISIILFTVYFIKWVTLSQFVALFVGIYGLQFISMIIYIYIEDRPTLKIDWLFLSSQKPVEMLRYAMLMGFGSFSSLGLKYLDIVMLGIYKPTQKGLNALDMVGIYSIAAFAATIVEAPFTAIERIIAPKIAHGWANNDRKDIQHIYYQSSKYLFLAGGIIFLLLNLNMDSVYQLIPDRDFALGKNVVLIISLGTLINMATGSNESILYTSEKYIYLTYILIGLIVVAYINYLVFIPLFGINGAAIATATSAALFNLCKYLIIWKKFRLQPFNLTTLKIAFVIIGTYLGGLAIPTIGNPFLDIFFKSVCIGVCFTGLCFLARIVTYKSGDGFQV
jgi:O-antigen/teichoic acid export membrane protein